MVFRLFSAKTQSLNQCCMIINWTLGNKLQSNSIRNSNFFIQENAFDNGVWIMSAILSRPQCVKERQCLAIVDIVYLNCAMTIRGAYISYLLVLEAEDMSIKTKSGVPDVARLMQKKMLLRLSSLCLGSIHWMVAEMIKSLSTLKYNAIIGFKI